MMQPPHPAEDTQRERWHERSAEQVLTQLGSSVAGLSAQEAARRLASDGPNELTEGTRIGPLRILLGQFTSLIVWILIAAGIISGVLGDMVDAIAILAIVLLNAVIGFYQEFSAEKSIAELKKMTAPHAKGATGRPNHSDSCLGNCGRGYPNAGSRRPRCCRCPAPGSGIAQVH